MTGQEVKAIQKHWRWHHFNTLQSLTKFARANYTVRGVFQGERAVVDRSRFLVEASLFSQTFGWGYRRRGNVSVSWGLGFSLAGLLQVAIVAPATAEGVALTHTLEGRDRSANLPVLNLAQTADLTEITTIRLEPTETGLTVILETAAGSLSLPTPTLDGDRLQIDIPNARLALPDSQAFQVTDPTAGITAVSVTQLDDNRVRILVIGSETVSLGESSTQDNGAVLRVLATPSETLASGEAPIRLVVTAEKTPEAPQDVPISLTVLTEAELVDGQINSIADIAANTPNFYFTPGDRVFNFYSVRGLGNSSNVLIRDAVREALIDKVPVNIGGY